MEVIGCGNHEFKPERRPMHNQGPGIAMRPASSQRLLAAAHRSSVKQVWPALGFEPGVVIATYTRWAEEEEEEASFVVEVWGTDEHCNRRHNYPS
jgi:hypothetical protein